MTQYLSLLDALCIYTKYEKINNSEAIFERIFKELL
jgi:hypothetical protein